MKFKKVQPLLWPAQWRIESNICPSRSCEMMDLFRELPPAGSIQGSRLSFIHNGISSRKATRVSGRCKHWEELLLWKAETQLYFPFNTRRSRTHQSFIHRHKRGSTDYMNLLIMRQFHNFRPTPWNSSDVNHHPRSRYLLRCTIKQEHKGNVFSGWHKSSVFPFRS